MKYGIGLDIGITSVGWSILALNENNNPYGIYDLGVRIFPAAENPKNGASLALPRREARSQRRRLRRHKHRLDRIKYLLISENILTKEQLDHLYDGKQQNIYELRTNALDRFVSNIELAKILLHLAQRRGFKSNRKADAENGHLRHLSQDKPFQEEFQRICRALSPPNYPVNFPNQVWSIDITYISMPQGHMYLTAIIDWYSRKIVGHYLSDALDTDS